MSLYEEISELIDLKTEGDYWDFKVQWHENKADLLHDIICMANNIDGCNAYLIYGADDNGTVKGIENTKELKVNICKCKSKEELINLLDEFIEKYNVK